MDQTRQKHPERAVALPKDSFLVVGEHMGNFGVASGCFIDDNVKAISTKRKKYGDF
jgi:hypothetical protein